MPRCIAIRCELCTTQSLHSISRHCAQTRKAKREAETTREEAADLAQRLAVREKRAAEHEARAEEAARAADGHRSELAGAMAAAKAREAEARQRIEAAEKRMAQVCADPPVLIAIDGQTLQRTVNTRRTGMIC